jgi:hypothetical protein
VADKTLPKPGSQQHRDILTRTLRLVDTAEKPHKDRIKRYQQRYNAYRGVLEKQSDLWQSQLHPPYAGNIVEILFSNLIDEHPKARVLPEDSKSVDAAKAIEKLLAKYRKKDRFDEHIRPWIKQALVMGVSPAKVPWEYERRTATTMRSVPTPFGGFELKAEEKTRTVCDQPTFQPLPVEDFWWDPAALRFDDCAYVCARYWMTKQSLKQMAAQGPDGEPPVYGNVDALEGSSSTPYPMQSSYISVDRKNRVEVIEVWERGELTTIANRAVLLQQEDNPFWHGKIPFVLLNLIDDLYSLEGLSPVELVRDLQACRWEFLNQTIDNVRLANNAIVLMRDTTDDPDKFVYEPGAVWPVSDPQEVVMWTPPTNVYEGASALMEDVKSQMEDLTGAVQFLSGAGDTTGGKTATEIATLQGGASLRIVAMRNAVYAQYREIGLMQIALIQQLMSRYEEIRLEEESGFGFETITPEDVQGECDYDVEDANESVNRQQARAEAGQLIDRFVAVAPLMQPAGITINWKRALDDLLEAYDKKNPDEYIQPLPPPSLPPQGVLAGPPAAGAGPQTTGAPPFNGFAPAGAPAPIPPPNPQPAFA